MQGVSINLFIKTSTNVKKKLGSVYHVELFGVRELKIFFA